MRSAFAYIMLSVFFLLAGCQKKELPVQPHTSGDVKTASVNMDGTYKYQIYYSLKANKEVSKNLKTAWDISFETSPRGFHIFLNSSKLMFALNTGKTDFSSVSYNDTIGMMAHRKCDGSTGVTDSTAIGDWTIAKNVFIVDKGLDEAGQNLGKMKIQFLSVSDSNYTVRFADVDGNNNTSVSIKKDTLYNLAYLSFDTKTQVSIEPPKSTWDLVFTQYTFTFYAESPPLPYLVTGCLLNRFNTQAVKDSSAVFSKIAFADVNQFTLTNDISTIGYNWKVFKNSSYSIVSKYNFIIRDAAGYSYKLHFTDFYDSKGEKGNPKWEYQQL